MDIVEKNRQDWEEYSQKYMAYNLADSVLARLKARPESAFDPAVWAMLKQYMPELAGKRVCVPSSGDNNAVLAFALLGVRVTSCDISQNQLAAAEAAAEKLGVAGRVTFQQEDTMRLDGIEDGMYDLVYTSNGVHVWLNDLPSMYRNISRVLKPGGMYLMYELHPFQRPFGEGLKAVKPYDMTGPFESEATVTFEWRIQDIVNAMLEAGIGLLHMEEIMPEPDYEHPFFVKNEDVVNGRMPSREEIDAMYDWRRNPAAVLPEMIAFAGRKMTRGRGIRDPEWVQSSVDYNRYFAEHDRIGQVKYDVLDVSGRTVAGTVQQVEAWLKSKLESSEIKSDIY